MRRRQFLACLGGASLAWSGNGFAQTPEKSYRLCALTGNQPISANSPLGATLLGALAQYGYTLGRNLTFDSRGASGEISKIPKLMQEFKASGVDAIVAVGYPTALAAKAAGIPTVIAFGAGDPVATGLVESLARPGGTVTGISECGDDAQYQAAGLTQGIVAETSSRRDAMEQGRPRDVAALRGVS